MPVHMSLRDRRAYSLQVAFLSATRTSDLVPPSDELEWATVQVRGLAKEAAEGKREGDLDRFLAESAKSLKHLAKIRFKGTPSRETAAILGRTQALVGRIVCKDCCGNAICKGEDPDHDDLIVATNAALCIHDIKSAFRLAERLTAESVRRSTGAEPPDVKMVLETTGLMEAPGQIPGLALANNAQTTFDDFGLGEAHPRLLRNRSGKAQSGEFWPPCPRSRCTKSFATAIRWPRAPPLDRIGAKSSTRFRRA